MKSHSVEVKLSGQKIVLKTQESPEVVKEVIEIATARLKEAEKRSKNAAPHYAALLALLDVTEEYVKAKSRAFDHKKELTDKSRELIDMIGAELQ